MQKKINVMLREKTGKVHNRRLRANRGGINYIPGVVYGFKEPTNIYMRSDYATKFIKNHLKNRSEIIELSIEAEDKSESKRVILQDFQLKPANNQLIHVDFREVTPSTIISIEVPIKPVGISNAVKLGGILQIVRHSISLKGKVADIPPAIEIDITELDFGNSIHVSDIKLPKNIIAVMPEGEDYTLISISAVTEEQEPEAESVIETEQESSES